MVMVEEFTRRKWVRAIFCDIVIPLTNKARWKNDKLQTAGSSDNLFKCSINYVPCRKRRVVMTGVQSKWNSIQTIVQLKSKTVNIPKAENLRLGVTNSNVV